MVATATSAAVVATVTTALVPAHSSHDTWGRLALLTKRQKVARGVTGCQYIECACMQLFLKYYATVWSKKLVFKSAKLR